MNILNKLTLKHLKMNKKRTIVSIIGIILSTALMVGLGLLISSLRDSMTREVIMFQGDYHVRINELNINKKSILDNTQKLDSYSYSYISGISNDTDVVDNNYKYSYILAGNEDFLKSIAMETGVLPTSDNEIVISDALAQAKNYKLGDVVSATLGNRYYENENIDNLSNYYPEEDFRETITKEYKIVGIYERVAYSNQYNFPSLIYTKENNYKGEATFYLKYKKPSDAIKVTENLLVKNLDIPLETVEYNSSLLGMYGVSGYDNINSFLTGFLSLFLTIVSLACIIVIYNSFAISVMERKKQFGLFSSIGATKKQIINSVFFEASIVGLIGIALGILAAYVGIGVTLFFLDKLLIGIFAAGLKLTTYPFFIIIPVIFMIVVVYISAYLPARRASKISPIEVIRQNDDIKVNKRKIKTSKLTTKLFGIEGEIALKNIKRNKKKYRITIVSLFISIVTFITFSSYLTYGVDTAEDYLGSIDYDIAAQASYMDQDDKEFLNSLKNHPDVETYVYFEKLSANIKINDKYYSKDTLSHYFNSEKPTNTENVDHIDIILLDNNTYKEYKKQLGLTSDTPIVYNMYKTMSYKDGNRILITRDVYNKDPNMSFSLCKIKNHEEAYNSENCDNYKDFSNVVYTDKLPVMMGDYSYIPSGLVFVNEEIFESIKTSVGEDYVNELTYMGMINIKANKFENLDKLGDNYSGSNFYYMNLVESYKMQMNMILAIQVLLYGFIALITLIGVTSVFNTINTSINLRRKEFSVLRSIGLTPKGFNKMIWYESLIFGLKSLLYALPVGICLSYLIHNQMTSLVQSGYTLPYIPIIIVIVAVFIIVLLTMIYATSKIRHENILDSIRDENI